jgi:hypothetical protein
VARFYWLRHGGKHIFKPGNGIFGSKRVTVNFHHLLQTQIPEKSKMPNLNQN